MTEKGAFLEGADRQTIRFFFESFGKSGGKDYSVAEIPQDSDAARAMRGADIADERRGEFLAGADPQTITNFFDAIF